MADVTTSKSTARNMTEGSIAGQLVRFALPLLFGNVFQMLYNTVDSLVVGNYVGTEALAAVGSTTMIVNMLVFFFNGMSIGAGVLIGQKYGAKKIEELHTVVQTTMALTFVMCVLFTAIGIGFTPLMLRLMSTPEDVLEPATTYLRIYFAGFSGLLIYNMGSGILRAVGDSKRPLYFLVFTSVVNTILDLVFVLVFGMGVEGVALATIIAQFISSILTLRLMLTTKDIYRFTWRDLGIDFPTLGLIFRYGLPAAIQSVLTAFSNVFVQSYINVFGSACMAGWSCFNKLDSFIFLPMSSMSMAATTFVSQNIGAKNVKRANKGTWLAVAIVEVIAVSLAALIFIGAAPAVAIFTKDEAVIYYGVLFLRQNVFFLCFNALNHTLAGAIRGRGDSVGPMVIMLSTFVGLRQIYLYVGTHFIENTERLVGYGYPVGWASCCVVIIVYYFVRYGRKRVGEPVT